MKALLVMEYDLEDGDLPIVDQIMSNVAIVDEAGARPRQVHIAIDEPAYKILSVIKADSGT